MPATRRSQTINFHIMIDLKLANSAHLQGLRALYELKNRELEIHELMEQKKYSEVVAKKEHYYKIVQAVKALILHMEAKYNEFNEAEKCGEIGQVMERFFLTMDRFEEKLMP